jgi:SET domain-containing protein
MHTGHANTFPLNLSVGPSRALGGAQMGAYASIDLSVGDEVCTYTGVILSGEEAAIAEAADRQRGEVGVGLFMCGPDHFIHPTPRLDRAYYVNHSCAPNLVAAAKPWPAGHPMSSVQQSYRVVFIATKRIPRGHELFIDYCLHNDPSGGSDRRLLACRCGAPNCRGTMLAQPT